MLDLGPARGLAARPDLLHAALALAERRHAEHASAARAVEELLPCGCLVALLERYWLAPDRVPLSGLGDDELPRVDASLPRVVDAHVHLFPDPVFAALWRWFERNAWPIRYKLRTPEIVTFLRSRGIARIVALHYAHKPGMARTLNAYVAEVMREEPTVTGLATVLPGEPDVVAVLEEAARLGLRGVKLHSHVQGFAVDAPELDEVWTTCARLELPVVVHAGREPRSPAYPVDPHAICGVERVERVLRAHPELRLCVPHLGADELDGYARLLERFDNLWLDTTMMLSGFFDVGDPSATLRARPERVLYGSDFPNLPYAWDRELRRVTQLGLTEEQLASLLGGAADALFGACAPAPSEAAT